MRHHAMVVGDFVQEKFLNQGAYGKVYEATFVFDKKRVAVKKVPANFNNEKSLRKEAEILQSIDHQNIVSILGLVDNLVCGEIWIVTELLNGGSLRPYCTGCMQLDVKEKLKISVDCCAALAYLHDYAKITHKDIKPENILLHKTAENHLIAKLCDFGLAKIKSTLTMTEETSVVGTFMYYPPEFAESKRNPRKADVYSLGATLLELFTNLHFWHNSHNKRRLEDCQILTGQPNGTMNILTIKGDENTRGSIRCTFRIPSGVQSISHPSPGRPFSHTCCTLYLPKTKYGRTSVKLLQYAFDQNLLFNIGPSDCVIWNFRTKIKDGIQKFDVDLIGNWVYTFKDKCDLLMLEEALKTVGVERCALVTDN